jgi:large-conductance mechanosensitive channel
VLAGLLVLFLFLSGCGESDTHKKVSLLGQDTTKVNPNSLAYLSADKTLERKNRLELSKIEANAKVEIAKIKSENELDIAKVNAQTQQAIAKSDSLTKITTSQVEASTHKESMQYTVYIVIAVIFFLLIALVLLYQNSKRNRELKKELQEEKLRHEQILKEKEHEERRLHKILDLAAEGKLPATIEEEVILSISTPRSKLIDSA